ncbi:hypothetical protein NQ317_001933 [Molorchus minor]|uniref:C2H2-type domain-containing protein n=1 Tax=Molorchus minor TaxID=1323400 RepID=A0ABQ9JDQ3_9CUCU|nr:hypothetical protein NQ317_001933 [Molorchus minor]
MKSSITRNEIIIKKALSNKHDSDFKEFDIKVEEHNIKEEVNENLPNELGRKNAGVQAYKYETCEFTAKRQDIHESHCLVHSSETLKCDTAEFETKHYDFTNADLQRHKNNSIKMYKCCECEYKTKLLSALKRHTIVHKNASEVTMYQCLECEYQTKRRAYLKTHRLIHKKASEVTIYKCCECDYKTKLLAHLKRHAIVHKNSSELTMYKCLECEYKTKHQAYPQDTQFNS